jgi:hypothetical protein
MQRVVAIVAIEKLRCPSNPSSVTQVDSQSANNRYSQASLVGQVTWLQDHFYGNIRMRIPARSKCQLIALPRQGYALLVCLFVAAISSVALLGILNVARFETLEVSARQRSAAATWAANAGAERAVAMLLDNPNLRGTLPVVQIPLRSGNLVTSDIQVNGQTITVTATATVGGISKTQQLVFTSTELQQRIANLN